jgi:hypothetical protein
MLVPEPNPNSNFRISAPGYLDPKLQFHIALKINQHAFFLFRFTLDSLILVLR